MRFKMSVVVVATALTLGGLLAACGGSSNAPAAATLATHKMTITSTTDVPGTFGNVGTYQQIAGDPRSSLEERYGTQAGYAALTTAADDLVARRFMLRVDADAAIANASAHPILP